MRSTCGKIGDAKSVSASPAELFNRFYKATNILNTQNHHVPALADCVSIVHSDSALALNPALLQGFEKFADDPSTRKSHLFNGRYENVYITSKQVPELSALLDEAREHASRILGLPDLRVGCWFNHMPPGAVTTAHCHDDEDELLSAAYYASVPKDSGQLIVHCGGEPIAITPEPGMFAFFSPRLMHEVTKNRSSMERLSIGINFGPTTTR